MRQPIRDHIDRSSAFYISNWPSYTLGQPVAPTAKQRLRKLRGITGKCRYVATDTFS